jgi:hypothetical protein
MVKKKVPSRIELRATDLGADYLISLAGWVLKNRPAALRRCRTRYKKLCVALLRRIEREGHSAR